MMRADNDNVVGNSVESFKDESKPNDFVEEKWEDVESSKISESGKNKDNELFYDTRSSSEWVKENDGNILESGDSNEAAAKKVKDSVLFTDKNVTTACDLPEIVVCYKEETSSTYNVVKDICVDEGVPVQEKFLFGDKDSVKCSSNSNQYGSEDLMEADKKNLNPFETRPSEVDDTEICKDGKTEDRNVDDFTDAQGEVSKELTPSQVNTSENVIVESLTLGDILSWETFDDIDNSNNTSQQQSHPKLKDKEKRSLETEDSGKLEEKVSSVSVTNKICNDPNEDEKLYSNRYGETSFSAGDTVSISGHITYSGPITFSGSLSVRSDASTTSGRSFAFPILKSEWNSSPVRMAKADKRRHKGWRHSLLCCRFS